MEVRYLVEVSQKGSFNVEKTVEKLVNGLVCKYGFMVTRVSWLNSVEVEFKKDDVEVTVTVTDSEIGIVVESGSMEVSQKYALLVYRIATEVEGNG